jgi:PmbA protein
MGYEKTLFSASLSLVADDSNSGENSNRKQSDGWYSVKTHFGKLDSLKKISDIAVERTLRKLGAMKPITANLPVIFEKDAAGDFISGLAAAAFGSNIYRRQSFLADRMGCKIGSNLFTLVDNPMMIEMTGSRPFDSEGVKSREVAIFENGALSNFLLDTYSGNKMKMHSTGAYDGFSNLFLVNGNYSLEEMISSIKKGILITSMFGQGANIVTGGYSRGAQGIWIEDGKLSYAVDEFTIASSFSDIIKNISMLGNDLEFNGAINSPSFKIENVTISGN